MFCKYCGNELKDDARFCNKCGGKLGQEGQKTQSTEPNEWGKTVSTADFDAVTEKKESISSDSVGVAKFGEDTFGSAKFGEDTFGSAKFGEDSFGSAKFGEDSFGSAKYGNDSFGATNFGNDSFGTQKYGEANNYNYSSNENKGNKKNSSKIGIIIGLVILLIGIVIGLIVLIIKSDFLQKISGDSEEPSGVVVDTSTDVEIPEEDAATTNEPETIVTAEPETIETEPETTKPEVVEPEEEPEPEILADDTRIHNYEVVVADVTWDQAESYAKQKGGYLARINSLDEYYAILNLISGSDYRTIHFFLGGEREIYSQDYYWVDADGTQYPGVINSFVDWSYDYWYKNEPSFEDKGGADGTTVIIEDKISLLNVGGVWYINDVCADIAGNYPGLAGTVGFIIEYN